MVKIKRENIRIEKIGKELEIGKTYKIVLYSVKSEYWQGQYVGHAKGEIAILHGFLHLLISFSEIKDIELIGD